MKKPTHGQIVAQVDQTAALLRDTLPLFLWTFYDALKTQGFTDDQSFELTRSYMVMTFGPKAPPQ